MSPALLLDEMLSPEVAVRLRERGHDVVATVAEDGLRALSDADLLAHATEQGRCLVTCNVKDFLTIARAWAAFGQSHGGIVCVVNSAFPQDRGFIGRLVQVLDALLAAGDAPGRDGVWFLSAPATASRGS